MKQNYDNNGKQMENQKEIDEEEDWASKARLVTLFLNGVASTNVLCNVRIY